MILGMVLFGVKGVVHTPAADVFVSGAMGVGESDAA